VVTGSDVYVAGYSNSSAASSGGFWKNGTWNLLPVPAGCQNSTVNAAVVAGTDVYLGGLSMTTGGVALPGYWKNGTWTALTPPGPSNASYVMAMAVVGTDVYAAGWNANAANVTAAGYWKNGTWVPLTTVGGGAVLSLVVQ